MSTGAVLGLTGAGIVAVSAVYYAVDVLRGGTRPQRTSWGVWALVGILGVASSDAGGAGPGMYAAAVDAVACAATFLLSLIPRYGRPGGRRLDPYLGLAAVAGVVLWQFGPLTDAGAAICAVTCDTVALWPTLRDARHRPDLESRLSWSTDVVGNGLCLAAVGTASVAALVYPIFLVVAAAAMTTVLLTAPAPERPGELADTVVDLAHARIFSSWTVRVHAGEHGLRGARPTRWVGPTLSATGAAVAIEEHVLVADSIDFSVRPGDRGAT
jgi:hypothetical protein